MQETIIAKIDDINDNISFSELSVMESIVENYQKAYLIQESYEGIKLDNFVIFQESNIIDIVTGKNNENESVVTKITHFIPRLIQAIIDTIKRFYKKIRSQVKYKIEQIEISRAMKLQLVSDPKYIEDKLEAIGCKGKISLSDKMLSVKIFDMNKSVEFKDDVSFNITEDGVLRVLFPYYKIDQISSFNEKIDRQIANAKLAFKRKSDNELIDALKNINKCFKGIATNQARISIKKFETIAEWDKYMDDVLDTFDVFSDKLKIVKKMFENMGTDVDKYKTPQATLIDDLRKLTSKTPNDMTLITKLNEKIHKVFDILTNPKSNFIKKSKFKKFKYNPLSQKDIVDLFHIDNSHIINAIDKFNKFYDECIIKDGLIKNMNTKARNSPIYKSAIEELNKQFNIKIDIKFGDKYPAGMTSPLVNKKIVEKIVVSKTKGFDCGGMKVVIRDDVYDVATQAFSSGKRIFGQITCSGLCHEIFHNISYAVNSNFKILQKTIGQFIEKIDLSVYDAYINFISRSLENDDLPPEVVDECKQNCANVLIYVIPKINSDEFDEACQDVFDGKPIPKADPDNIREIRLPTIPDEFTKDRVLQILAILTLIAITSSLIESFKKRTTPSLLFIKIALLTLSIKYILSSIDKKSVPSVKNDEESMCDLFAAIYQLPISFDKCYLYDTDKDGKRRFKISNENSKYDTHSNDFDRFTVSYELTKKLLNSGEVKDPQVKEYLEYIMDIYDGLPDKERILTKRQLKKQIPTYTDDLNNSLSDLIKKLKINVTEYMTFDTTDDVIFEE